MNSEKATENFLERGSGASRRQRERIKELQDSSETLEGFFIEFCGSVNFELFYRSKGFDIKIV